MSRAPTPSLSLSGNSPRLGSPLLGDPHSLRAGAGRRRALHPRTPRLARGGARTVRAPWLHGAPGASEPAALGLLRGPGRVWVPGGDPGRVLGVAAATGLCAPRDTRVRGLCKLPWRLLPRKRPWGCFMDPEPLPRALVNPPFSDTPSSHLSLRNSWRPPFRAVLPGPRTPPPAWPCARPQFPCLGLPCGPAESWRTPPPQPHTRLFTESEPGVQRSSRSLLKGDPSQRTVGGPPIAPDWEALGRCPWY